MSRSLRWWFLFGVCNVVVAATLAWMTAVVFRLERAERTAREESAYHEALRSAMWRMDSWLAVFLARENARPYEHYRPPRPSMPGEATLAPSPLLALDSEYLPLHFEIDSDRRVTSPQLPLGPLLPDPDVPARRTAAREAALERIRPLLDLDRIRANAARAESIGTAKLGGAAPAAPRETPEDQAGKSRNEYAARVSCALPRPPGGDVGRLLPQWLAPPVGATDPALIFVRRVRVDAGEHFQGFLVDWPRLRRRLLGEIADLFPVADLQPLRADDAGDPLGRSLANIPAALVAPAPGPATSGWLTPGKAALGLAWLATALAAVVVGATLKKSIALGERRRRFVSAVTHELRTPLTTFRLYSEMLADGVVRDEAQRRDYLRTLKDQAHRLSLMVENVLAHSRLEEHGAPRQLEALTLDALLARVVPPLSESARLSGVELRVERDGTGATPLEVDVAAIARILGNLVDNAVKYGRNGSAAEVHLEASAHSGSLTLRVRDHGPGIAPDRARDIFAPFERGGRDAADPVPGIGLGLALARGMARDMGGDLTLDGPCAAGACFRLCLPGSCRSSR